MSQQVRAERLGAGGMLAWSRSERMPGWRFPLAMSLVMLALLVIGGVLGLAFIPKGPWFQGGGVFNQMLSWDGQWYASIAHKGYSWDPKVGELLGHYQSTDFYPLYPLLERLAMVLAGNPRPVVIVVFGELCGIASIFTFHRLALRLVPEDAARRATFIYAIWPAAIYFGMGYPTGLINLCVIASLAAYAERRFWLAAFWCGVGTAAAPTVVFIAVALCLDRGIPWLRQAFATRRPDWRAVPALIAFGLMTVAGLIGYMAFQLVAFHDPFTFIKAQEAWGVSPPLRLRLTRFFSPSWYWFLPSQAYHYYRQVFHIWRTTGVPPGHFMQQIQWQEQSLLCFFTFLLGGAGLIVALRRLRPLALPGAALAVYLGYTWFITTTEQNLDATPRLLYPALALFIGLGLLFTPRRRWLFVPIVAALVVLTLLNNAFCLTGYWLV